MRRERAPFERTRQLSSKKWQPSAVRSKSSAILAVGQEDRRAFSRPLARAFTLESILWRGIHGYLRGSVCSHLAVLDGWWSSSWRYASTASALRTHRVAWSIFPAFTLQSRR